MKPRKVAQRTIQFNLNAKLVMSVADPEFAYRNPMTLRPFTYTTYTGFLPQLRDGTSHAVIVET